VGGGPKRRAQIWTVDLRREINGARCLSVGVGEGSKRRAKRRMMEQAWMAVDRWGGTCMSCGPPDRRAGISSHWIGGYTFVRGFKHMRGVLNFGGRMYMLYVLHKHIL